MNRYVTNYGVTIVLYRTKFLVGVIEEKVGQVLVFDSIKKKKLMLGLAWHGRSDLQLLVLVDSHRGNPAL